jgi:urease accessory protein
VTALDGRPDSSPVLLETDPNLPAYVRADAAVVLKAKLRGSRTILADINETGASRARFPNHGGEALEATLVNMGGGIAGGDRFTISIEAGEGAKTAITTAAAERVYRSLGQPSDISTTLIAKAGSELIWLPQELILYDGARLRRRIEADIAPGAMLCLNELMVLGRGASGETMTHGLIDDRWRIRRSGELIFADNLLLDAKILSEPDRPARLAGFTCFATLLLVSPHAEDRLDMARNMLQESSQKGMEEDGTECAASAWNGMLLIRGRAKSAHALKLRIATLWRRLNLFAMPRLWA